MAHPAGLIDLWFGAIIDIPIGWALCDGNNGTPDLRDRFVPGAGGALSPGDEGGSENHNHDFTGDGHDHNMLVGGSITGGAGRKDVTDTRVVTGTTDNGSSLPPFHALAYIMHL